MGNTMMRNRANKIIGKRWNILQMVQLTSKLLLIYLAMLLMVSDMVLDIISDDYSSITNRHLSVSLGDGNCKWTGSRVLTHDDEIYGTLLAGYPASGMRVLWQQLSGLTGINVRDDFFELHLPKIGIVKTQYPHYEGIWSYGSNLQQTILLIRNPRWAMPSYHTLLSEIGYAHTWNLAYDQIENVFTRRAPMEDWIRWRDYRFNCEMMLWGWFIDFYMYNGTQYWMDYDFERNGQLPFRFRTEEEKPWPQNTHCIYDSNCVPQAVVSYEHLRDPVKGPDELRKLANVLRGQLGYEQILEDEAIECIWHETWIHAPEPSNDNRDLGGLPREAYNFTLPQLYTMEAKLEEMITKYEADEWANNTNAVFLVENFNEYLIDVSTEIAFMEANPQPTPAPNANYTNELKEWYRSLGKGGRYDDIEVPEELEYLYDDDNDNR